MGGEKFKPTKFMADGSFYDEETAEYAVMFIESLCHIKGKWAGEPFKLLPWQKDIIRNIFGVLKEDGKRQFTTAYIEIPKKNGKQLDVNTPIPTTEGFSTMGELKVGDTVFDENGKPCRVVAKSIPDSTEKAYRLTFRDCSTIVAGERHLWDVEYDAEKVQMTTGEIYRSRRAFSIIRIPVCKTLEINREILTADSYIRRFDRTGHTKLNQAEDYHYLKDIEPLDYAVTMQCIQVDSPSHEYLAGTSMIPTHNSELAAAVALYLLFADGEASPEVYGAAADRQQASIVFDVANSMVKMSPALIKRSKILGANKRIVNHANNGFYQVLSAEVGCVTGDTIMQMANGSIKKAKDVKPGDRILASNGLMPVFDEVVSVEEQEPSDVIEVVTHHKRVTTVSEKHPFYRMEHGRRKQDLTHEYDWYEAETLQKDDRLAVSLGWPSEFILPEDKISELEAWSLGAWAGDGDCTHFRFINPDEPVIRKLQSYIKSIGSDLKSVFSTRQKQEGKDLYQEPIEHIIMGKGKRRKSPGREWVRKNFGQHCKAKTKRIPDTVWKGGEQVWAAFLAGYIDTDGCVMCGSAIEVKICSVSEEMRKDCQILCARLGINASVASELNLSISGKPQLRKLWRLISPYMVHPRKRERLKKAAGKKIFSYQRSSESDKVVSVKRIENQKTLSFEMKSFQTHVTDGLITHNTKHGLNVSGLVLDEVHAQPNRKLYDVLTKGSGDAREQPLFFLITTAGNDVNSICYELHQKAVDIIEGRKIDPTFYPVIYGASEAEDWTDPEVWKKANPSLGETIQIDKVEAACESAKQNPAEENSFRQLRLNQWVKQAVRWMPMGKWDKCSFEVNPAALEGRVCYGGLDLSSTTDITAFVLVFPPEDEDDKYYVIPYFWIPEECLDLRVRRDHVPYDIWEKQGFVKTTEGNVIHYGFIEKFIEKLGEVYNIREIAFDRWGATQMTQDLEEMGFNVVPFGQGFSSMSPPTKELMKLVLEEKIAHGGNPVLRWMVDNIFIRTDPAGNIKIDKSKSTEKVDGAVAVVMALDRAIRCGNDTSESVYDSRGILLL